MHEENTFRGPVRITAARGNRGGIDVVTLTIRDVTSLAEVVDVTLTMEEWGQIVSGAMTVVENAGLYAGQRIGKKHVVEDRLIPFGADAWQYAREGEVPDEQDATNFHNRTSAGEARVAFHRWE